MSSDSSDSDFDDLAAIMKEYGQDNKINDSSSDEEIDEDPKPQTSKKRRRKSEDLEDEQAMNAFLFGDKEGIIKKLEGKQTFFLDVAGNEDDESEKVNNEDPVWHDSDDDNYVEVKGEFAKIKQKRKLERIIGKKPKWADLDRQKEESEDEDVINQAVGHLNTDKPTKSGLLAKNLLNFKRLKNMNRTTQSEGRIKSCEFHPKSTVGIVSGSKGIVSMFAIDGKENRKIHDICYEKFFIHSCKLTNNGEELVIGGTLKDFHIYNLMTGYKQRTRLPKPLKNLKYFQFSNCGKYMAVIGEFGEVHLLHSVTKELLCTMKQEHQSTSLSFSSDSNELYSHSDDNEITIFDIRTQRVKHRFVDDGCVNGTVLTLSSNGKFLATGSRQGFVNIYDRQDVINSKYPQPLKSISNLTTEITDLKFNHTTELLAMCSIDDNKALKLVHVESGSVFSNFPSNLDTIGKPTVLAFSPESGYLGVGTFNSEVPMYRLRHYNNY
ncbi:U3 small nucleolar RNA-associated protein 18 homolog [Chironomus tepperi]|uniref:U3 small nucleolar RNA-associated protein 18 homolog n=1 Tax=Chironomus tepperi TaxID=113505 RepID=UPI00391F5FF9